MVPKEVEEGKKKKKKKMKTNMFHGSIARKRQIELKSLEANWSNSNILIFSELELVSTE